MINKDQKLVEDIFNKKTIKKIPIRDGYGKGVVEVGEKDERIVVLCADLMESTRSHWFEEKFPERYIEIGVAEQNLATVAAGLAIYGKIPFISSYAVFSPGRNNEQIRTLISLNNLPVKIIGAHAGVSVGPDGATHQALEDIALMRVQPNMTVVVPADMEEAQKAILASVKKSGPFYLRLAREKTPLFTTKDSPFEIGKANVLYDSDKIEIVIIACGSLVYNALLVAEELSKEKINVAVINNHSIKPMDNKTILKYAQKAGAVVTVEEHQIAGGMGSAVAELLAKEYPVPIEFIGVNDRFGQSGTPDELIEYYGMGVGSIKEAVKKVIKRKSV
ncbi:transketolase [Candidatus Nomurabacteria bacterium RIFCSPLOWO2_01_FULL_33_24]|uniref:Transketolase n=1 Tax=Candidatus Nomurabacteria bacterium RIFCSPLOWO2_01_FULL_33_24 TaxID=1801765 RepID=A0A1F6X0Q0_9BACT|nr:MAG: transketolase [Candidatus Nomurabacteria bacterium RIFCSPLOWO2_01_FULL_33_24]